MKVNLGLRAASKVLVTETKSNKKPYKTRKAKGIFKLVKQFPFPDKGSEVDVNSWMKKIVSQL